MNTELNGHDSVEEYIAKADDADKRVYLDRVWAMNKVDLFKELIRVHGVSSELLTKAQQEIDDLRTVLAEYDKSRH
jgi:hypothetical protein